MRGRPFEVSWRQEDTPEALKAPYQGERDPELRTRLHGLWLLRSGWRLHRYPQQLVFTTGLYSSGWVGIEREACRKLCRTRWGARGKSRTLARKPKSR